MRGEERAIDRVEEPVTRVELEEGFRALGLGPGDTLLVHASLSSLGWVCGGAQAVVDALMSCVTETGTLVMPTFTGQYTDPASWENPPVPEEWVPTIRESMPPFRPDVTPSRGMGAIPECFRRYPGVRRSEHPLVSFAAWGSNASVIVDDHALAHGLGEDSPLARVYDAGGTVLQIGVDHDTNSSIHLAEHRADIDLPRIGHEVPMRAHGERVVRQYEDVDLSTDGFVAFGERFEAEYPVDRRTIGAAEVIALDQPTLVDAAVAWLTRTR